MQAVRKEQRERERERERENRVRERERERERRVRERERERERCQNINDSCVTSLRRVCRGSVNSRDESTSCKQEKKHDVITLMRPRFYSAGGDHLSG